MSIRSRIKRWWHSRTMWLNIAGIAGLAPLAAVLLTNIDVLGLSVTSAGQLALALNMFITVSNMYLKKQKTAHIGEEIEDV